MDLVVGATGILGAEIAQRLAAAGRPLAALVRPTSDASKLERLKATGITLAYGDLKERSTLDACCQGISTVISTASSTFSRQPGDSIAAVDHDGQLSLIEAAKAAGVRHFIFVSFPPVAEDFALQRAKRAVEQKLRESGLAYTVLQPTFFTEIWLSPAVGFDFSNAQARIYGSGTNKISWISYLDVAAFAVASLENPAARNAVIKLGGPEALSPLEVVKIFEEVGGRPFAVEHVPEEALRTQKAQAKDVLEEAFAGLMLYYAEGEVIDLR
ncbi:MAG: SDR family oxidoreductase, partial [Terriglobia bacterium]